MRRAASLLGGEPYRALAAHAVAGRHRVRLRLPVGRDGRRRVLAGRGVLQPRRPARDPRDPRTSARAPGPHARGLLLSGGVGGSICVLCFGLWVSGGGGYAWWLWVWLGVALVVGVHALIAYRDAWLPGSRSGELAERVDKLTRTRRGALDVQAARAAPDRARPARRRAGAARRAEHAARPRRGAASTTGPRRPRWSRRARERGERRDRRAARPRPRDRPAGARRPRPRPRRSRRSAGARRCRSTVDVELDARRPPPVVETAAYFVVAEALTNVAKHAPRRGRARARCAASADGCASRSPTTGRAAPTPRAAG